MRARVMIPLALLVVGAAVLPVVSSAADDGSSGATDEEARAQTTSRPSHEGKVTYPEDLIALGERVASSLATDGYVRYRETDDSPVLLASEADEALSFTARQAAMKDLPYNVEDVLIPLRDRDGTIAAYMAANVPSLSPDDVSEPGFDLCALEVEGLDAQLDGLASALASGEVELPDGADVNAIGHQAYYCAPNRTLAWPR